MKNYKKLLQRERFNYFDDDYHYKEDEPRLLILHEKYGCQYFHCQDEETLLAHCLDILQERLESGNYYYEPQPPNDEGVPDSLDDAQNLPEGKIRDLAIKIWREYNDACNKYELDLKEFQEIQRIVKEKDGFGAWYILQSRGDYEYEGFELITYSKIHKD